jgi:hypothetical protein
MVKNDPASIPFVVLMSTAAAGSRGANRLHTVRTACDGTAEMNTIVSWTASATSAVGATLRWSGTPGK